MGEAVGRLLAAGNVAEVFELGGRVVKLYRRPEAKPAAFREAAVHAAVEAMGLPVPAVWGTRGFGGRWGVVFDRVDGTSFADRMQGDPAAVPGHLGALARLQAKLHEHPADQLRDLKGHLASNIRRAGASTGRGGARCWSASRACRTASASATGTSTPETCWARRRILS